MAPVRVTIKSKIPEFQGLNIVQSPIETDITWSAFFQFHEINFDPNIHGISSTRNIAFAEDTIQQTSDLFQRRSISVNIIRLDNQPRTQRIRHGPVTRGTTSNLATPGQGPSNQRQQEGRRRNRGQRVRFGPPIIPVVVPMPMPSTSRGTAQRNVATPGLSAVVNGAGARAGSRNRNPLQIFPEDLMDNGEEDTLHEPVDTPEELEHLIYAESIASQDSQETEVIRPGNSNFSQLKLRIMREIERVPNADFEQMMRELKNLVTTNQKYRWQRKAPMVGSIIFQAFNI